MTILITWAIGCVLVGLIGKKLNFNFWQGIAVSILVTPIIGLLAVILCQHKGGGIGNG
jgi:hypothetical protein